MQALFSNAFFFTYALVLGHFYRVNADDIVLYLRPFAMGNFLGPLLRWPFFDILGRRAMISATYAMLLLRAALAELGFRVAAERRSLEAVAAPLSGAA